MSNKMPDRMPECQIECQSIFLAERMPGRFFRSALFKWIFWFFAGTTCFPSLSASTLKEGMVTQQPLERHVQPKRLSPNGGLKQKVWV